MPDAPAQIVGLPVASVPPACSLLSSEQLPKVDHLIIEDGKPWTTFSPNGKCVC